MIRIIEALSRLIGWVVTLVLLAFIGWIGWNIYQGSFAAFHLQAKIKELETENESLRKENSDLRREVDRLRVANRLLKVDTRVAILDVIEKTRSPETGALNTTFIFREVDGTGRPVTPDRKFTISGDILYIDAWVAKFQDEFVELGDPLRGSSIYLFRRLFSEDQRPSEGFVLDEEGSLPLPYRNQGEASEFEKEIWENFWFLANNPNEAARKGLRAVHGEAVYMKLEEGKRYRIQLRASDGLTIVPEGEIVVPGGRAT